MRPLRLNLTSAQQTSLRRRATERGQTLEEYARDVLVETISPARLTIAEIARAAGVGTTTVSVALSGRGPIDRDTQLRIKALARRLGWRPSPAAQHFRRSGRRPGSQRALVAAIAQAVGLTLPTVYLVLADKPRAQLLREETRQLIRETAVRLGWRPKPQP